MHATDVLVLCAGTLCVVNNSLWLLYDDATGLAYTPFLSSGYEPCRLDQQSEKFVIVVQYCLLLQTVLKTHLITVSSGVRACQQAT